MLEHRQPWFLKLIIFMLFWKGVFALALSVGLFSLLDHDLEKLAENIIRALNLDVENYYINLLLKKIGMAKTTILIEISIGLLLYAILQFTEAYGLHMRRRWGEYLTVGAVGILIPFEIYEVIVRTSLLRVAVLALNVAVVYYLLKHKELFPRKVPLSTK